MKFNLKILTGYILIACYPFAVLNANPSGHSVQNGSALFSQQGNTLNITNTPGTIINWQDFSINEDETTKFIQQSIDSAVLNRVTSQNPSDILGSLQSNGRVFIINPNGISFGKNSIVDVGGLVASTLNLSNEDFLSQQLNFNGDGTNGGVTAQGEIITPEGGFVYLIAPNVENHGVITSPKGEVLLAAGHSVQLIHSDNPDIRVTLTAPEGEVVNVGDIITRGGKTSIYAGLISQQGTINADSAVVGENGKIFLKASTRTTLSSSSITTANGVNGGSVIIETTQGLTEVSGKVSAKGVNGKGGEVLILGEHVGLLDNANIDASGYTGGGTVLIGGDNKGENPNIKNAKATYVGVNTQIHADAIHKGDGGKVILWSDDATRAYGTITAKGGTIFGNGGFVETSGGYLDVAGLNLDVTATNGNGGAWLLDPFDIIISGTTTVNSTAGPVYTPTATASNIFAGDIVTQLNAGTSVTVDTTGAGAESGNITVNAAIIKTTGPAATLTLKAHNNIITNFNIGSVSGALGIVLTADQDSNGVGSVTLNGTLNSLNGNVTINAAGDITFNSGTDTIDAGTGTVTLTSTNGLVHGDPAGAPTDVTANTVIINALNGIFANSGAAQFTTKAANITFNKSGTAFASEVKIHNSYAGPSTITGINSRGNISIFNTDNANALTVGNLTATTDGYISINTDIIDVTGSVNAGTNVVYLKNFVNNAAISLEGGALFDLNSTEIGNISAGNIQIGKDPFGNYAGAVSIGGSAAVNLGGKNVWITGQNGITTGANSITNTGGQLYIDNIITGDITTGSGLISSDYVQFRTVGIITIGSGGINSTAAGDVYLLGADVNVNGSINAGTNNVFLAPYLSNTAISIGGSQSFNLTSADLNNITAGSITIGENLASAVYASTVDIATTDVINIGAQKLRVLGNNNITFGANNFTATGTDIIFKSGAGSITTGAGLITAPSLLDFIAPGTVTIGTGGLNANDIAIEAGDINISGNISGALLYLNPYAAGTNISIGGSEIFNLVQSDINNINSTNTYIGNDSFVVRTNNIDIGSVSAIDFGTGLFTLDANTGITTGSFALSATGGSLTMVTRNVGADITTGSAVVSASNLAFTSAGNLTFGTGGVSSAGSVSMYAANSIIQNGNINSSGAGAVTLTASTADITMASGTTTTNSSGDINLASGNNIVLASLNAGTGNITVNAGNNITDANGTGVNNIDAANLTVIAGANASLDYQITNTLNASGVVGTADLRVYPGATAATAPSSTNEPLTTTIDTISDTTNSLSTNLNLTSTSTSTAPLPVESSTDTTTEETLATTTTSSEESTTAENSEEETKEEKSEATENKDGKKTTLSSKKLPICK